MTPKSIITIGILLLLVLIVGAGQKFYLSQYEEECYEYQKVLYLANWTYQTFSPGCYLNYDCRMINKTYFYNSTKNGKCVKYNLVRKA